MEKADIRRQAETWGGARILDLSDFRERGVSEARTNMATSRQTASVHRVSGDWLARTLRLDPETTRQIAGLEVELDPVAAEALGAVRRTRLANLTTRSGIGRRRAEIWPESTMDARNPKAPPSRDLPIGGAPAACTCDPAREVLALAARFVDSEEGDDNASGSIEFRVHHTHLRAVLAPWQTLRRVERWLDQLRGSAGPLGCVSGAEVYLRRGRTWDGTEEKDAFGALRTDSDDLTYIDWDVHDSTREGVLNIEGFNGTEEAPLIIGAYGSGKEEDTGSGKPAPEGSSGVPSSETLGAALPVIAGTRWSDDAPTTAAPYGDLRGGIAFRGCCHVAVRELLVRGFGTGIRVRGHSKDHTYTRLRMYGHATHGLHIGVVQTDAEYVDDEGYYTTDADASHHADELGARIQSIVDHGDYPEDITISDCTFWSTGYDTAGADLMIGFLSTNCTVRSCRFDGDGVRGLDGVELVGASSGHLIEGNTISDHAKFCHPTGALTDQVYKSVFQEGASASTGWLLRHPCDDEDGGEDDVTEVTTPYGYAQLWYDDEAYDLAGTASPEGQEAYGENGIALKAVRVRTPTSRSTTHIRDNVIYRNQHFAGITVYEGSQAVLIYRNRVLQNATGIAVWNTDNNAWYNDGDPTYYMEKTRTIVIWNNDVYMNREYGIYIASKVAEVRSGPDAGTAVVYPVESVVVIGNVVAHNLSAGVYVTTASEKDGGTEDDVTDVLLTGNLIIRNGRGGESEQDQHQVCWAQQVLLDDAGYCWSDENCFLGWVTDETASWAEIGEEKIIFWGRAQEYYSDTSQSVTLERASGKWGIESAGVQVEDLSSLDLACFEALYGVDGSGEDGLEGKNGDGLADVVSDSSATATLLELDYTVGPDSACLGSAEPVESSAMSASSPFDLEAARRAVYARKRCEPTRLRGVMR